MPAIPILIGTLPTIDGQSVWVAYYTLGRLKLEPQLVMAAWTQALESTNKWQQIYSCEHLPAFGELSRPVVPALRHSLNSPDYTVRLSTYPALRQIAPEVLTNVIPPPEPKVYGEH